VFTGDSEGGRYWDRTSDLCRVKADSGGALTGEKSLNDSHTSGFSLSAVLVISRCFSSLCGVGVGLRVTSASPQATPPQWRRHLSRPRPRESASLPWSQMRVPFPITVELPVRWAAE
jgi:hypothetical protein